MRNSNTAGDVGDMSQESRLNIDSPIYPLKRRVEAINLTGAGGMPAMPARRESRLRGYRRPAPTHGWNKQSGKSPDHTW